MKPTAARPNRANPFIFEPLEPRRFLMAAVVSPPDMPVSAIDLPVKLTDSNGNSGYAQKTAISQAADLTSINGSDISPAVGDNPGQYVDTIYDLNPSDPSDYTVTIDWGDGTALSEGYVAPSSTGTGLDVFGSHNYASVNSFTVTYTITKKNDPSVTLTSSVEADVSPSGDPTFANLTGDTSALASQASTITGTLGTFNGTLAASGYTASVDWGDGSTTNAQIVQQPDGSFAIVGSHDYGSSGTWQISITLSDTTGNSDYTDDTAVSEATPLTSLNAPDFFATTGANSGLYVGTFLDLNQADPSDYNITINWGDGTTSPGTLSASLNGGTYDVMGDHNYQTAGNYLVTYSVTKNDDPTATLVSSGSVMVADPGTDYLIDGIAAGEEVPYLMNYDMPLVNGIYTLTATEAMPSAPVPLEANASAPTTALSSITLSPTPAASAPKVAPTTITSATAPPRSTAAVTTVSVSFASVESAESNLLNSNQADLLPTTQRPDKLDSLLKQ